MAELTTDKEDEENRFSKVRDALSDGRSAQPQRILSISNPNASTMSARLLHLVVYALQGRYDVDVAHTHQRGHAMKIAKDASTKGYDAVCVLGGDGTVNEVANGLAGTSTPMTCLPGGATNVYCRILGIPGEIVSATEHLLLLPDKWVPRAADLGRVNDRYFTFSAGVGVDASAMKIIDDHPRLKSKLGPYFFTAASFATFFRYATRPLKVEVTVDGSTSQGVSLLVQNARPFSFLGEMPIELFESIAIDSGVLSAALAERINFIDLPAFLWRGLSRSPVAKHRAITSFTDITDISVSSLTDELLPMQADGDYLGEAREVSFTMAPGALQVIS